MCLRICLVRHGAVFDKISHLTFCMLVFFTTLHLSINSACLQTSYSLFLIWTQRRSFDSARPLFSLVYWVDCVQSVQSIIFNSNLIYSFLVCFRTGAIRKIKTAVTIWTHWFFLIHTLLFFTSFTSFLCEGKVGKGANCFFHCHSGQLLSAFWL